MTRSEFIGILEARGIPFKQDGTSLTVNGGDVDLPSLTSLPEGTTFSNGRYVYLRSLTSLPEGTTFSNGGGVYLRSLTSLPEGTTFSNGGDVDLDSLTSLPEGTTFSNGGDVYLDSLTSLPEGTTFSNGRYVYLPSLTSLPEGTTFSNGGGVDLDSLTSLPEGTTFSNGGGVDLDSLTSLPEGTTFSNGGGVRLPSLTEEHQTYQGQRIRLRTIDNYTMLLQAEKQRGEYTIYSARYFGGGDLDKLRKCFIARSGDTYAHGETIADAIADLRFKLAEADFDRDDLIAQVKARGVIRREDFRLLTGACSEGLRHGLVDLGQPEDLTEMPLATALELVRGRYGEREMREAFA